MLINKNLLQELYEDAGYERTRRAKEYAREGKIDITKMEYEDPNNFEIHPIKMLFLGTFGQLK